MLRASQPIHRLAEVVGGLFREAGDADVADAVVSGEEEVPRSVGVSPVAADRVDLDHSPHDLDADGLLLAFVEDRQGDRRAGGALDEFDGFLGRHPLGPAAVDLQDYVAGANARLVGRRAGKRREDRQLLGFRVEADLHADALEPLVDRDVELLLLRGRDVVRVSSL